MAVRRSAKAAKSSHEFDLQGFLDGLQAALPVTVRRTADGVVYVDPRH